MTQMEQMIEELKSVKDAEDLVEVENGIAGVLGRGFLKGTYEYSYMQEIKESVERIEEERRGVFESMELHKQMTHKR
ncbi:MAG: hypothetical protein ACI4AD_04740 [Roseburia sp.]